VTLRRVAVAFVLAAIGGIGIFGVMVWRAVDVEQIDTASAARRMDDVRARFAGRPAVLMRGPDGTFVRRPGLEPPGAPGPVTRLHIWSYRPAAGRLARADIAFWFYRLKAPAAQWAVNDTGLDLDDLGLSPDDLTALGPSLLVDESSDAGALLVWTQ
jgi:hypothetical protein